MSALAAVNRSLWHLYNQKRTLDIKSFVYTYILYTTIPKCHAKGPSFVPCKLTICLMSRLANQLACIRTLLLIDIGVEEKDSDSTVETGLLAVVKFSFEAEAEAEMCLQVRKVL
jgi:hypothetical protein